MRKVNTGTAGSFDVHYNKHEMSSSMKILRARLIQLLDTREERDFYDLYKSEFVHYRKSGGDDGWVFRVKDARVQHMYCDFELEYPIRKYYSARNIIYTGTSFDLEKDAPENVCKKCNNKKYIINNGWNTVEPCECNEDVFAYFYN